MVGLQGRETVSRTSASSSSSASQIDASNSLDASFRPRSTSERYPRDTLAAVETSRRVRFCWYGHRAGSPPGHRAAARRTSSLWSSSVGPPSADIRGSTFHRSKEPPAGCAASACRQRYSASPTASPGHRSPLWAKRLSVAGLFPVRPIAHRLRAVSSRRVRSSSTAAATASALTSALVGRPGRPTGAVPGQRQVRPGDRDEPGARPAAVLRVGPGDAGEPDPERRAAPPPRPVGQLRRPPRDQPVRRRRAAPASTSRQRRFEVGRVHDQSAADHRAGPGDLGQHRGEQAAGQRFGGGHGQAAVESQRRRPGRDGSRSTRRHRAMPISGRTGSRRGSRRCRPVSGCRAPASTSAIARTT